MVRFYTNIIIWLFLTYAHCVKGQTNSLQDSIMTFEEYLGYVKQHHPLVKQANLRLSEGEATLLRARGGFDPKVEVDYSRKKFKNTEYYDLLNTTFKIPTWYGIEFKGTFEENTGAYLDPSLTVPPDGLYSAGVSLSLAQGLFMNERMATLKKARFFVNQTQAERNLLVNDVLYQASLAYFQWVEAYNQEQLYKQFLENALVRFEGTKRSVEEGEKAAIDSIEARITYQNRQLSLEAATLKRRKTALNVSNYLWLNDVPLILEDNIVPELPSSLSLQNSLSIETLEMVESNLENHPKLNSLDAKIQSLEVDRFLYKNKLLPKIDLQYNFLSQDVDQLDTFNTANYKSSLNIYIPLFLRKERGDLKLANIKLQDANWDLATTRLSLRNKLEQIDAEIASLESQTLLATNVVEDYRTLVSAEERKFQLGESSLFLVASREQSLIEASLKAIDIQTKQLQAIASLFNTLGISDGN
ncbi:TolC family protein [Subsaxibacter sp. CAU 1640]|uniref:TolC family protein n=1 Tax=Subsaxibacter sp. CAU 1640 TaxID=2933271 RepID=UPI0020044073|nr:TolC family protein [Subsaxibacter sp. CAU 1640]MCK7590654.1 TolC family protein [Subsaxibacter sp. CAU 1640]